MTALLGVLVFDTLPGLFIGITVSLLLLLYRTSRPNVAELGAVPGSPGLYADRQRHPEYPAVDGIAILRVESGLFFANAAAVRHAVQSRAAQPSVRAFVIDAETIPFVDVTAVRRLDELAEDLTRSHVTVAIAHDIGQVRDMLHASGATPNLHVYPTVQAALDALDPGDKPP